jgi:hypothetical protein
MYEKITPPRRTHTIRGVRYWFSEMQLSPGHEGILHGIAHRGGIIRRLVLSAYPYHAVCITKFMIGVTDYVVPYGDDDSTKGALTNVDDSGLDRAMLEQLGDLDILVQPGSCEIIHFVNHGAEVARFRFATLMDYFVD